MNKRTQYFWLPTHAQPAGIWRWRDGVMHLSTNGYWVASDCRPEVNTTLKPISFKDAMKYCPRAFPKVARKKKPSISLVVVGQKIKLAEQLRKEKQAEAAKVVATAPAKLPRRITVDTWKYSTVAEMFGSKKLLPVSQNPDKYALQETDDDGQIVFVLVG